MQVVTLKNGATPRASWLNPRQPPGFARFAGVATRKRDQHASRLREPSLVSTQRRPRMIISCRHRRGPRTAEQEHGLTRSTQLLARPSTALCVLLRRPDHCREQLQSSKIEVLPALRGLTGLESGKRLDHRPDCDLAF